MFKLDEFKQLVKDFSDIADFLVIYIAEAHSTGEWKSPGEVITIMAFIDGWECFKNLKKKKKEKVRKEKV